MAKSKRAANRPDIPGLPALPDLRNLRKPPKWEDLLSPQPGGRINQPQLQKALLQFGITAFDINLFLASMIVELICQRILAAMSPKTPNAAAFAEWKAKLKAAVYLRLTQGGSWANDGANVLQVATDMGTMLKMLCGQSQQEANINQLKAAFAAAKTHSTCQANSGVGGGAWCTFDWF